MGNHFNLFNRFNQVNMDFLNQTKIDDNGDEKMALVITIDAATSSERSRSDGSERRGSDESVKSKGWKPLIPVTGSPGDFEMPGKSGGCLKRCWSNIDSDWRAILFCILPMITALIATFVTLQVKFQCFWRAQQNEELFDDQELEEPSLDIITL